MALALAESGAAAPDVTTSPLAAPGALAEGRFPIAQHTTASSTTMRLRGPESKQAVRSGSACANGCASEWAHVGIHIVNHVRSHARTHVGNHVGNPARTRARE